jgi:hypothetical protein
VRQFNREYYCCTIFIYVAILPIAIGVDSIEIVFNFLGAVREILLTVILPCLLYVNLVKRENGPRYPHYYIAWVLLLLAVPFSFFSMVSTFRWVLF